MPPLHKYLGNPVRTWIGRLLFRSQCKDFHCGLRGFNRTSVKDLGLQTTGMEFASEMVVMATLMMLWILPATRQIGSLHLDIHTLVYAAAAISIGFQSVIFAVFTKIYGVNEGLLPRDTRLEGLFRFVTLETGLIVGIALGLAGLAGSIWAVSAWGSVSFSELDPQRTLRVVIPSVMLLTIGFQIFLSSFFLSILGLNRNRGRD
jgi:hypothetical protein